MKQLLAILLILSHVNFSMFIPQVDEVDVFNKKGQQVEDINSLFQFVSQSLKIHHQDCPKDNDDDCARYFHLERTANFIFQVEFPIGKKYMPSLDNTNRYGEPVNVILPDGLSECFSPPPEC